MLGKNYSENAVFQKEHSYNLIQDTVFPNGGKVACI